MRNMTEVERHFAYTQDEDILEESGCIGHLRADLGGGFFSSWDDHVRELKTDAFKEKFDRLINRLREDFLADRTALGKFCFSHYRDVVDDYGLERWYYRIDEDGYSYFLRLSPYKGEYNLYCYCYVTDMIDKCLGVA